MGRVRASAGKSHSWLTPTTRSPAPSANRISVPLGTSETIRMGGSLVLLCQICRPRSVGPHHPGPLLPASPPSRREQREKEKNVLKPLSPGGFGEGGGERGLGSEGQPRRGGILSPVTSSRGPPPSNSR